MQGENAANDAPAPDAAASEAAATAGPHEGGVTNGGSKGGSTGGRATRIAWAVLRFPVTKFVLFALLAFLLTYPVLWLISRVMDPPVRSRGFQHGMMSADVMMYLAIPRAVFSVAAFLALFLLARFIERRPAAECGLGTKGLVLETAAGFGAGFGLVAAALLVLLALGYYEIVGWGFREARDGVTALATALILMLAVAVAEEIVFRGVIFRLLEELLGSWGALLISGFLFGMVHVDNPNSSVLAGVAIAIEAGLMLGALYMLTRQLWAVIGMHWAWNTALSPVFGTPVSGISLPSVVEARLDGPALWTGGAFGVEASLPAMIAGGALSIVLLVIAHRRGQVRVPAWAVRMEKWRLARRGAAADVA